MHLVGKCEDCGEIVHFSLSTNTPPVRRYEDDNLLITPVGVAKWTTVTTRQGAGWTEARCSKCMGKQTSIKKAKDKYFIDDFEDNLVKDILIEKDPELNRQKLDIEDEIGKMAKAIDSKDKQRRKYRSKKTTLQAFSILISLSLMVFLIYLGASNKSAVLGLIGAGLMIAGLIAARAIGERYAFSTVNERVEIIMLNHRISDLVDLSKSNPIEIIRIVKGIRKKGE